MVITVHEACSQADDWLQGKPARGGGGGRAGGNLF